MTTPCSNAEIDWKNASSWVPLLTCWLQQYASNDYVSRIRDQAHADLYRDDPEWLTICDSVLSEPIAYVRSALAEELSIGKVCAYHACRTDDAATYHRHGIQTNDPETLSDHVRHIVASDDSLAFLRPKLEEELAAWEYRERDAGKLYLVADDRELIQHAGHYLIYGSEWIVSFLGFGAHYVLRSSGIPTMVSVTLPLSLLSTNTREHFAKYMMQEWTRLIADETNDVREIDFSFILEQGIPAAWVTGHYHPDKIPDPLHQNIVRSGHPVKCQACL